jgi:hypothetical protein
MFFRGGFREWVRRMSVYSRKMNFKENLPGSWQTPYEDISLKKLGEASNSRPAAGKEWKRLGEYL